MDNPLRERRIRAAMDREATHAVPHADLWAAIGQRIATQSLAIDEAEATQRDASKPHPIRLRLRLTSALAVIVVLALGLGIALPALLQSTPRQQINSPAVTVPATPTHALDDSANLMPITMSNRAQPLHLSQTVSGYTVTLDRVYLDASTLMFSYDIAGPHTRFLSAMGDLAYTSAAALNSLPGGRWQVANQVADGAPVRGIASFDPPAVISPSLALNLRLSLTRNPAIEIHSVSPPLTPNLAEDVAGPFEFSFSAPFVGDLKAINVGQQATASGVTISMAEALLTPSQTQLRLRYSGPAANPRLAWQPDLTLIGPNGQALPASGAAQASQQPDGSWVYAINAPLFSASGHWTVRIDALHGYDLGNTQANETQITGPWTFQLTIPTN